jgi:alpha-mannosidase
LLPADTVPTGGYWERVTFKPPSVPGLGYRAFELVRGNNVKRKKLKTTENTLENRYLKVEVSSHTGGIVSIYDKKAERELVDNTSSYHLNQFLYYIVEGISLEPVRAGLCDKIKRKPAKIKKVDFLKPFTGKVRSALRVRTQIENGPAPVIVENEIRLSANSRKIEIINTVLKNPTEKTEEGYFSFPFDMPESTIRVEQAGCIVKIPNEQLSGSATHCSGIQDWVNISSENYNITFSSKEAGLVKLGKINHIQHVTEPAKPVKPYIFSFCFHNNWYTNCTRWQGGPWQFRFALTLNNEKFNPVSTYHEGIGANYPLRACVCNKEYKKTRTAQKNSTKYILSFLKLSPSNLMVSFMKPLTNSNAISLCLFEIAGQSGEGIIDTSNLFMSSYEKTDLQGYSIEKRRTIKKAKIIFRYGKHEILRFNLYKYNGNALEN